MISAPVIATGAEACMDGRRTHNNEGHRWFAAAYDRISRGGEKARVRHLRKELLSGVTGDVLEIGAGTGANFEYYDDAARVIALEPDPHMLKRAEAKLRPNIELRQAPAESLPFPDASFDAVVSTLVLCTVSDVPRALDEIRRVLRPGGKLIFIEHIRADGIAGGVQRVIRRPWRYFSAGCNVDRATGDAMKDASFAFATLKRTKFMPIMPVVYGVAEPE
jgi:ubiquinone/menaquinone biosynthesis C-methylase UbiE